MERASRGQRRRAVPGRRGRWIDLGGRGGGAGAAAAALGPFDGPGAGPSVLWSLCRGLPGLCPPLGLGPGHGVHGRRAAGRGLSVYLRRPALPGKPVVCAGLRGGIHAAGGLPLPAGAAVRPGGGMAAGPSGRRCVGRLRPVPPGASGGGLDAAAAPGGAGQRPVRLGGRGLFPGPGRGLYAQRGGAAHPGGAAGGGPLRAGPGAPPQGLRRGRGGPAAGGPAGPGPEAVADRHGLLAAGRAGRCPAHRGRTPAAGGGHPGRRAGPAAARRASLRLGADRGAGRCPAHGRRRTLCPAGQNAGGRRPAPDRSGDRRRL